MNTSCLLQKRRQDQKKKSGQELALIDANHITTFLLAFTTNAQSELIKHI